MTCPQCGHTTGRQARYCPACAKRLGPPQPPGAPLAGPAAPLFVLEPNAARPSAWHADAPYLLFLVLWATTIVGGGGLLIARAAGSELQATPWLLATAATLATCLGMGWRMLEGRRLSTTRYAFRPYRLDWSSHVFTRTDHGGVALESIRGVRIESTPEQARRGLGTLLLDLRDPGPGRGTLIPVEDIADPELWCGRIQRLLALVAPEPDETRRAA